MEAKFRFVDVSNNFKGFGEGSNCGPIEFCVVHIYVQR